MYDHDIEDLEAQVFGTDQDSWEEAEDGLLEDEVVWEEGPVMLTVTLQDGGEMECRVDGVFLDGGREYIALETEEGEILIMGLGQGEEGDINLLPIEDEEEQERALDAYGYYFMAPETDNDTESGREDDQYQDREKD